MRGVTLAEAALTSLLVALVVLVLASMAPVSWVTLQRGESWLTAEALAQSSLEEAQFAPFATLVPGARALPAIRQAGIDYHSTLEVLYVPDSDPTLLKALRIKVRYQERGGWHEVVHERWVHGLPR